MRPGLWTGFFLEESRECNLSNLLENINRLKSSGFECGELDERNAYALFVDCNEEVAEYNANKVAEQGFITQIHGPKPKDDFALQNLCEDRIIKACLILGVKTIVMHPFVASTVFDEPKEKSKELLKRYVEKAEKYGIRIALENQIYPVDMDFYLKEIPGLCVNLDFAHAIASGYDVVSMIEKYADKLAGLHVSDSDGRKEDYHIMPKKGIVNWDMAIKSIEHSCYDGDLHLEIVHERSTELSENNEKAKQSYDIVSMILRGK